MTYQEFLNSLISPITYFINWLGSVADSLISNYIVITLLGLTLFVSVVYFIFNLIVSFRFKNSFDADNVNKDKYILNRGDK